MEQTETDFLYQKKTMEKILQIYLKCQVKQFPIDCVQLLKCCGFRVYTYKELREKSSELYAMCNTYSRDAFTWRRLIAYNEKNKQERIRFSLMHELGHIAMNTSSEDEADIFASNILAPRVIIHFTHIRTADRIHDYFGLSFMASNRALADYRNWYRHISWTTRQHTETEEKIKQLFIAKPEKREEALPEKTAAAKKPLSRAEKELEKRLAFLEEIGLRYDDDYHLKRARYKWLYGEDD